MKRINTVKKRGRQPHEIATKMKAIRNHCLECMGYVAPEVEFCTAPECWLYPWRFGITPEAAARQGKDV